MLYCSFLLQHQVSNMNALHHAVYHEHVLREQEALLKKPSSPNTINFLLLLCYIHGQTTALAWLEQLFEQQLATRE